LFVQWNTGAADPHSGTAALLEIARGFGILKSQGWKPQRSITLCSWDAEEYVKQYQSLKKCLQI
jgi:N-acetylated-alpha-linked acidic dipeptidase